MSEPDHQRPTEWILDEEVTLTLSEVSRCCGVPAEAVLEMVEEGIIEPVRATRERYFFTAHALWRARTASRLQRDLQVNLAGAAVAVELIEEIHRLRRATAARLPDEPFDEL